MAFLEKFITNIRNKFKSKSDRLVNDEGDNEVEIVQYHIKSDIQPVEDLITKEMKTELSGENSQITEDDDFVETEPKNSEQNSAAKTDQNAGIQMRTFEQVGFEENNLETSRIPEQFHDRLIADDSKVGKTARNTQDSEKTSGEIIAIEHLESNIEDLAANATNVEIQYTSKTSNKTTGLTAEDNSLVLAVNETQTIAKTPSATEPTDTNISPIGVLPVSNFSVNSIPEQDLCPKDAVDLDHSYSITASSIIENLGCELIIPGIVPKTKPDWNKTALKSDMSKNINCTEDSEVCSLATDKQQAAIINDSKEKSDDYPLLTNYENSIFSTEVNATLQSKNNILKHSSDPNENMLSMHVDNDCVVDLDNFYDYEDTIDNLIVDSQINSQKFDKLRKQKLRPNDTKIDFCEHNHSEIISISSEDELDNLKQNQPLGEEAVMLSSVEAIDGNKTYHKEYETTGTEESLSAKCEILNIFSKKEFLAEPNCTETISSIKDDDSCSGYNSSDFEFITEEEASRTGLLIKHQSFIEKETLRIVEVTKDSGFSDSISEESSQESDCYKSRSSIIAESSTANNFSNNYNYRNNHVLPEGEAYLNLFQGQYFPTTPLHMLENKSTSNSSSMNIEHGGIGFNIRLINRQLREREADSELLEEAERSGLKILELYPIENRKRRRRL